MIDNSFALIESFLHAHGISAIFFLGFFEELFFFVPSTVFFIAIGFFAIDPYASFGEAFAIALGKLGLLISFGILVGGWIVYGLVYGGGKPLVLKLGKYVRLRWDALDQLHRWFEHRPANALALLFLRIIPVFPIGIVSIFCGLIRISLWKFTWTTFWGSIPRVTTLALLGWYLGKEYSKYAEQIAAVEYYILFALVSAGVLFLIYFYRFRKRSPM